MEIQAAVPERRGPEERFEIWASPGVPEIRVAHKVLDQISEFAMRGFRSYPWGGVELGGVLYGSHEEGQITVNGFTAVESSHEYGPSYELNTDDETRFAAAAASTVSGQPTVGWFHTLSRRELALSQSAGTLHKKHFPEAHQVALVVRRAKGQPLEVGFFVRNVVGELHMHSPVRTWTPEPPRPQLVEAAKPVVQPEPPVPPPSDIVAEPTREEIGPTPLEVAEAPSEAPAAPQVEPIRTVPPRRAEVQQLGPYATLGLQKDPFAQGLDLRMFCPFEQHRKALGTLRHRVESGAGFVALLGDAGVGKSLLLEELIDELQSASTPVAHISDPSLTVAELYETLAHAFDLDIAAPTKVHVMIALTEHVTGHSYAGLKPVMIVDNADQLSTALLQEIHLIGNVETRAGRVLQTVIAAQPHLTKRLEEHELRGLRQRILYRVRLEALTLAQTEQYVARRLALSGLAEQNLFAPVLIERIHAYSHGLPRLINLICGELLDCCVDQKRPVPDLAMLMQVTEDLPEA